MGACLISEREGVGQCWATTEKVCFLANELPQQQYQGRSTGPGSLQDRVSPLFLPMLSGLARGCALGPFNPAMPPCPTQASCRLCGCACPVEQHPCRAIADGPESVFGKAPKTWLLPRHLGQIVRRALLFMFFLGCGVGIVVLTGYQIIPGCGGRFNLAHPQNHCCEMGSSRKHLNKYLYLSIFLQIKQNI